MKNREVTTDLYNILSLINCSESYGFCNSILIISLFEITGKVSNEEIESYASTFLTKEMREKGYTEEDYDNTISRLEHLRNKYNK